MTIRVGVFGSAGRMGSEVVAAVNAADDLELVACIDENDDPQALVNSDAQVVVDFTNPGVVMDNLRFCIANGIHTVVGTSGFTPDRIAAGGTVLRQCRDHRTSPPQQARRPLRHGTSDGGTHVGSTCRSWVRTNA